jgi:hypothetical protein
MTLLLLFAVWLVVALVVAALVTALFRSNRRYEK